MNTGEGSNLANICDKTHVCELCVLWCVVRAELDSHDAAGSTEKIVKAFVQEQEPVAEMQNAVNWFPHQTDISMGAQV